MVTQEFKTKVIAALAEKRKQFTGSDAKYAISLELNAAQYSRIKGGETEKVISDSKWISLGRMLDINPRKEIKWNTANTPVFNMITEQLAHCQTECVSALLCDLADIGKTYTAKIYAKNNKNVVYVDCSQVKTKQKLVRFIAKELGLENAGKYSNVYDDLVYYIKGLDHPAMIILDEAGDLAYDAFLELKALWNATERACGWFMMGADGLKEKIRRSIDCKKVGFTEIFSRYGKKYQRITPEGREDATEFATAQAAMIIKANMKREVNIQKLIVKTDRSLRRIYTELSKIA